MDKDEFAIVFGLALPLLAGGKAGGADAQAGGDMGGVAVGPGACQKHTACMLAEVTGGARKEPIYRKSVM